LTTSCNNKRRLSNGTFSVGELCLLLLLFLFGALRSSVAQPVPCAATVWKKAPPKAVVDVSLSKKKIHTGEWAVVTFPITNCGSFPFYIPKTIQNVEWHGGFEDIVTGPPNAKGQHSVAAADYGPDYHPDVLKEVKDSWILLMPGEFYGGTVRLNTAPETPGTWKVVARRSPPRVTDELREQLRRELKFPVLFEPIDSNPAYLKVVK
jgi:hypothetical protein